jgi:hypothetical protein
MQLEEALPSLTRNRPARAHRAAKRPEREKEVREIENGGLLFHESEIKLHSGDAETESSCKGIWYSEEPDRDLWSSFRASIARQTLCPGETVVGSLSAGKRSN